jgi:membrane fusion protein (multidrug efflux system)
VELSGGVRLGALTVPQRAVLEGPNTKIVLTVNPQGVVEPRPVQAGDWSGEDWVITDGLKPGDRVIVDGMVKARPGSPVKIADAAATAATPAPPGAAKPAAAAPGSGKPQQPAK